LTTVLIESQYLPPVGYFAALHNTPTILLERHEHYVKQSYRNRCYINAVHGRESLTVPTTAKHGKVMITDIRIDYGQKWLSNHWRTITSAYGKAPFFEHYAGDLEKILFQKREFLYDLNYELLSLCLKWLRWGTTIKETLSYEKTPSTDIIDLRSLINPKKMDFLNNLYKPTPYYQVFGSSFAENASFIDLIFCEGPSAARVVQASSVRN